MSSSLPRSSVQSRGREWSVPRIHFPANSHMAKRACSPYSDTRKILQQTRICEYWASRCYHKASFFDLKPAIRQRIYNLASNMAECDVCLNDFDDLQSAYYNNSFDRHSRPKVDFTCALNLLLTSRLIYVEVASTIYSQNRFYVRFGRIWSLMYFMRLSAISFASLRYLAFIICTTDTCDQNPFCCIDGPWLYFMHEQNDDEDDAFVYDSPRFQDALGQWKHVAGYIPIFTNTAKLSLEFICDTVDRKAAIEVLRPFERIKILKTCSIRLSPRPDRWIRELAAEVVHRLTARIEDLDSMPFAFCKLPQEIRYQILSFTDLVTPNAEVHWNSTKGYQIVAYTSIMVTELMTDNEYSRFFAQRPERCWHWNNFGCFCANCHGAYSSPHHCWAPPTSLFLVCRRLLHDARAVFFSRNRFIVLPETKMYETADKAPSRLAPSIFLTDIVPSAFLKQIRFLEIVFPQFGKDYLSEDSTTMDDWKQAIEYAKSRLNLPQLTLRIYISEAYQNKHKSVYELPKEFNKILEAYATLLKPLSELRAVKWFFADIHWPLDWVAPCEPSRLLQRKAELDQFVEQKWVMGTDYDSTPGREAMSLESWTNDDSHRLYIWNESFSESGWFRRLHHDFISRCRA